jgi:hypothetical protein
MKTAAFITQGRRMTYKIIAKFKQKIEEGVCFTVNSPRKGVKMYVQSLKFAGGTVTQGIQVVFYLFNDTWLASQLAIAWLATAAILYFYSHFVNHCEPLLYTSITP